MAHVYLMTLGMTERNGFLDDNQRNQLMDICAPPCGTWQGYTVFGLVLHNKFIQDFYTTCKIECCLSISRR